jgi:hypothetical protein
MFLLERYLSSLHKDILLPSGTLQQIFAFLCNLSLWFWHCITLVMLGLEAFQCVSLRTREF